MDIAYYLSELLGELGGVNVPGLGKFTQRKIDGYYNEEEAEFYPPANTIDYDPNYIDDEVLAEYIAEKKKISVASSKYFTEKYVNNIKQEAISKDMPLGDLGWLRFVVHDFHFKSAEVYANDPTFFSYPKIALKKLASTAFLDQMEALEKEPKEETLPAVVADEPVKEELPVIASEPEITLPEPETVVEEPVQIEPPVAVTEPELPVPIIEETQPTIVSDEPVKEEEAIIPAEPETITEPEAVLPLEPVKESEPAEFDLEAYLRELEASAGIASPESPEPGPKTEPLVAEPEYEVVIPEQEIIPEPEHEIIAPQQEIHLPEPETITEPVITEPGYEAVIPEPEIKTPEPEIITPDIKPYIASLPTVELPREPYTPDSELQQYILDSAKPAPEAEVYTPKPVAAVEPGDEEEFIFDGKGYDNVDNPRRDKRSLLWLWIVLAVIVLAGIAGAGYVYYMHQQKVLKTQKENNAPVPMKVPLKKDTLHKVPLDSLNDTTQATVIKDTTEKAVGAPAGVATIDSTKVRFELIGVSVKTIKEANLRVVNYKTLGVVAAHVLMPGKGMGKLIKVSLGTFMDRGEAITKKREIINTGNIRHIDIIKIN